MCPNIIPVNRTGLVVELVLTRCHWEKGRREDCNDLYEMYCGLKDPGWLLVQLSQNLPGQQNACLLTSMPQLELSVLDFSY